MQVAGTIRLVGIFTLALLSTTPLCQDYMDASRPPPGFMKNLKVMFDVRDVSSELGGRARLDARLASSAGGWELLLRHATQMAPVPFATCCLARIAKLHPYPCARMQHSSLSRSRAPAVPRHRL